MLILARTAALIAVVCTMGDFISRPCLRRRVRDRSERHGGWVVLLVSILITVSCMVPKSRAAEAGLAEREVMEELGKLGITVESGQALPEPDGVHLSMTDAHIKLRTDQLSKRVIEAIARLTSLKAMYMVGPEVTDASLERVKSLKQIRALGLVETKVTDAGLKHVNAFIRLHTLLLAKNDISGEGLKHLSALKHLRALSLFGTPVGDSGLGNIMRLTSLRKLSLRYTKVTDAGLEHLRELPRLRKLNLSGTGITDAGLTHIVRMADLEWLELTGTRVTDAGVRAARKALPKCEIIKHGTDVRREDRSEKGCHIGTDTLQKGEDRKWGFLPR